MQAAKYFVLSALCLPLACFASGGVLGSGYASPSTMPGATPGYSAPYGGYGQYPGYANPYGGTPYGVNPYVGSPYIYQSGLQYNYYRSPYNAVMPGYGAPVSVMTPYGGSYYNMNFGGNSLRLWRSQSGYYYPWAGGYGYNSYPIFVVPGGQTNPTPTLPPISAVVNDLDEYLDKVKEKGKVSADDLLSLKRRANDLLSKEKSLAYEAGGTLDPDQEADIRRDLDELSGEVARRVRP